ncbi:MAG: hypothetical protein U1E67_10615 [Hyphomicrobiales bacterium]
MDSKQSARLAELAEAFGADPARWPPEERALAALLEEADLAGVREIDAVLAHAGRPALDPAARMAAMSRIMASTSGSKTSGLPRMGRAWSAWAPAATALAASFALGIYLGSAGLVDNLIPSLGTNKDIAMLQDFDVTGVSDLSDLIEGGSS